MMECGTNVISVFSFGCLTLISGLVHAFIENPESWITTMSGGVFYFSLSVNIIQILFVLYDVKKDSKRIKKSASRIKEHIETPPIVLWPEDLLSLNQKVVEKLKASPTSTLKIICYGTNKFAGLIGVVIDNDRFNCVKIDIVLCSPDAPFLASYEDDKKLLKSTIDDLENKEQVLLHKSKIPPTMRAVAIYDERDNPIFCSIQPYYFSFEESGKKRFFRRYTQSPAIFADDSNEAVLNQLAMMFKMEYDRLPKERHIADSNPVTEVADFDKPNTDICVLCKKAKQ